MPGDTPVTGTAAPPPSTTRGAAALPQGDSNTTTPPTSALSATSPTTPAASTAADTKKAPYARSVVKEAGPSAGASHTGKKRITPPCDCSSMSLMATVEPMFSSIPPLFFTHALFPVVEAMPIAKLAASVAASSRADTRTAGGQDRQKPFTLAQGLPVYLFSAYTVCLARASSALSAVCVAPISSVGHIAAKLAIGYSLLHQGQG